MPPLALADKTLLSFSGSDGGLLGHGSHGLFNGQPSHGGAALGSRNHNFRGAMHLESLFFGHVSPLAMADETLPSSSGALGDGGLLGQGLFYGQQPMQGVEPAPHSQRFQGAVHLESSLPYTAPP